MACEHDNAFSPGENILEVSDLCFSYGRQEILRNINMAIPAGKICGLFGPNGCGKTTLFRCCLHFLQPASGNIMLFQKPLRAFTPEHLAQHIAYVPQQHQLVFPFTVSEMVQMGRSPHLAHLPVLSSNDHHIVDHAMQRVGIAHLADQAYSNLSGGQRQLVLVARALAQQASLIFLDEPTSSLDFANQLIVWEALIPIAAQGVGIFICCHDPNHILWFCDNVVVMKEGQILGQGPTRDILTESLLHELYGRHVCLKIVGNQPVIFFERTASPSSVL